MGVRKTVKVDGVDYDLLIEIISAKRKSSLPKSVVERCQNVRASKLGHNVVALTDEKAVIRTPLFDVMQNDIDHEKVHLSLLAVNFEKRYTRRLIDAVSPRSEECDRILRVLREESM